eukprot:1695390-Prymnesium_polylepis.2
MPEFTVAATIRAAAPSATATQCANQPSCAALASERATHATHPTTTSQISSLMSRPAVSSAVRTAPTNVRIRGAHLPFRS